MQAKSRNPIVMAHHITHSEIIDKWRYRADLVRLLGVPYTNVQGWHLRSSIPPGQWPAIEAAAIKSGISGVTVDVLRAAALAHRASKPPRKKHVRRASQPTI